MTQRTINDDVLEQNVSTLLETGGESRRGSSDAARARIRADAGREARGRARATRCARARTPLLAIGARARRARRRSR